MFTRWTIWRSHFVVSSVMLIHKWNEPYLSLLPSLRASLHFDRDSLLIPLRITGWVGQCGLVTYRGGTPTKDSTNLAWHRVTLLIYPWCYPCLRGTHNSRQPQPPRSAVFLTVQFLHFSATTFWKVDVVTEKGRKANVATLSWPELQNSHQVDQVQQVEDEHVCIHCDKTRWELAQQNSSHSACTKPLLTQHKMVNKWQNASLSPP